MPDETQAGDGSSPISSLELKSVGELLGKSFSFFVPAYQRGYRWGEKEVTDLLNDIDEFFRDESKEGSAFYCLQPLVVKKKDSRFSVIDGQQRLTTLRLILDFLGDSEEKPFSLSYETRENSEKYLTSLAKGEGEDRKEQNIDFFHLYEARENIKKWFEPKEENFKKTFLEWLKEGKSIEGKPSEQGAKREVKFIWYEASENEKEEELFSRLNMGKIPLNDAELIRALFLKKKKAAMKGKKRKIHWISFISRRNGMRWSGVSVPMISGIFWAKGKKRVRALRCF